MGASHLVFCDNRGQYDTAEQKQIAADLRTEIRLYHAKCCREEPAAAASAAPAAATEPRITTAAGLTYALLPAGALDEGSSSQHALAAPIGAAALVGACAGSLIAPANTCVAGYSSSSAEGAGKSSRMLPGVPAPGQFHWEKVTDAELQRRNHEGRRKAAALCAADTDDFACLPGRDKNVFPKRVGVAATREAAWWRRELSAFTQEVRSGAVTDQWGPGVYATRLRRDLTAQRTVAGKTIRERPSVYDHCTHGTYVHIFNLATPRCVQVSGVN